MIHLMISLVFFPARRSDGRCGKRDVILEFSVKAVVDETFLSLVEPPQFPL